MAIFSLQAQQGIVKHIYKGTIFIFDYKQLENSGFFCAKPEFCKKIMYPKDACDGIAVSLYKMDALSFLFLCSNALCSSTSFIDCFRMMKWLPLALRSRVDHLRYLLKDHTNGVTATKRVCFLLLKFQHL